MRKMLQNRKQGFCSKRGVDLMNIHIPKVFCLDCNKEMILVEGTNKRICGWCNKEVRIEVVEE